MTGYAFVCWHCGFTSPHYAPVERHVDAVHGSGRIESGPARPGPRP